MAEQKKTAKTSSQNGGKKTSKTSSDHTLKPENTGKYVAISLILNSIFGFMGVGVGFVFFVGSVIAGGSMGLMVLVFGGGAVIIVTYLYIIAVINRFVVGICSDKKSKRVDKKRLLYSMIYVIVFLLGTFVYSFLRAGVALHTMS